MLPFTGSWIEMVLYVGAGIVLALYGYHVLLSLLKPRRSTEQAAKERADQLLQHYHGRSPQTEGSRQDPSNPSPTLPKS